MNPQEIEAKFYVRNLKKVEENLIALNAILIQPRVHETNLRYDTAGRELSKDGRVLRIRQDEKAKMTYKGNTATENGIQMREEIEFEIQNFEMGKMFLDALGYEVMFFFEKFRTTYDLNDTHVMLDELPFGTFVEVEGSDVKKIEETAAMLRLDWKRIIHVSYRKMYESACAANNLPIGDISFAHFNGLTIRTEDINILPADE